MRCVFVVVMDLSFRLKEKLLRSVARVTSQKFHSIELPKNKNFTSQHLLE